MKAGKGWEEAQMETSRAVLWKPELPEVRKSNFVEVKQVKSNFTGLYHFSLIFFQIYTNGYTSPYSRFPKFIGLRTWDF